MIEESDKSIKDYYLKGLKANMLKDIRTYTVFSGFLDDC